MVLRESKVQERKARNGKWNGGEKMFPEILLNL